MPRHPAPVLLSLITISALVAACSGGSKSTPSPSLSTAAPSVSAPVESPSTATSAPSASVTPPPSGGVKSVGSLFSGRTGVRDGRVLVVKLDNTRNAEPHQGLQDADVVYIEQVEAGLTRYAAVFSTRLPKRIGPIRSARISDIDLFAQYGKVAFAYSGAQHRLRPVIAAANLINVSGDVGPRGYYRDFSRPAPYNFFGNGPELLARAQHAVQAHDVGFRFSTTAPPSGSRLKSATVRWPSAKALFTWNAAAHRWLLTMDGVESRSDGLRLGGTTVVIQYVNVHKSSYGDKFGGVTPMSETVGKGKAVVLRDGLAYSARWSRPTKSGGTAWTTPSGAVLPFAPGQVWVLLVNQTTRATLSR